MTNIVPMKNSKPRSLRVLRKFTDDLDWLVDRHAELNCLLPQTKEAADRLQNADEVAALFARSKKLAALSERDEQRIARCNEAMERFDPASAYMDADREDGLRRDVIGERLALLVGAFPNGAPSDPVVYAASMIESVGTVETLCLPALDAAIWEIIATMKFIPAVSEVLEIVRRQAEAWNDRFYTTSTNLAERSRRLLTRIEALEVEAQAAAKVRAEQEQAATIVRAAEAKARALEQARRAYQDAEDAYCDARRELADKQEVVEKAMGWLLECQSELGRAEAVARTSEQAIEGRETP